MYEVEQKFHVADPDGLVSALLELNATESPVQSHADTYFNHPSRDFAQTHEALRIRRVDGVPMVTYKGTKLPGAIKARREMEWRLDPGDIDGSQTQELWTRLGFRLVAVVSKRRRTFVLDGPLTGLTVVVDDVETVGSFAEIESMADDDNGVEDARNRIESLANRLNLDRPEQRSYLRMLLELQKPD